MKVPLVTMTVLGLSLIAYGLLSMMRQNPGMRSEVMKHLSPENQVRLNTILTAVPTNLSGRFEAIDNIDKMETCTGPSADGKIDCPPPATVPSPNVNDGTTVKKDPNSRYEFD